MKSQSEIHFTILKECVENNKITGGVLAKKLGLISEDDISIVTLEELKFIKRTNGLVELLPQGYSTYLSISSQKQSSEQASRATYIAIYAIIISTASFIANIIFNILAHTK